MKIFKLGLSIFTLALILVSCNTKEDITPISEEEVTEEARKRSRPISSFCDNTIGTIKVLSGAVETRGALYFPFGYVDGIVTEGNSKSFKSCGAAWECTVGIDNDVPADGIIDNDGVLCITNLDPVNVSTIQYRTSNQPAYTPAIPLEIPVGENVFLKFSASGCELLLLN